MLKDKREKSHWFWFVLYKKCIWVTVVWNKTMFVYFRYRCLRCFNFDMCQNCFFSGRKAKHHKLTHPIQEYCTTVSINTDIQSTLCGYHCLFSLTNGKTTTCVSSIKCVWETKFAVVNGYWIWTKIRTFNTSYTIWVSNIPATYKLITQY